MRGNNMRKKNLHIILPCTVALALYLNTLDADFAYDDSRAIQKNQDLLPETPVANLFFNDFWGTPLQHSGSHKSYRPLCVLSFRLNYILDGFNPRGYHLGNVLLHVLVTGLFSHLAKLLLKRTFPTYVAGLLFAAHPIHTEAVAGVVGRADVGACMFFLLAFLSYIKYCKYRDKSRVHHEDDSCLEQTPNPWGLLFLTAIFTTAGMLTKEQGVTVLAVCAIYDAFIFNKLKVQDIPHIFSQHKYRGLVEGVLFLGLTGFVLIGIRILLMGSKPPEFAPADNPAADSDSLLTKTLTFLYLPVLNVWLLICPKTLSFDWSMEAVPLLETSTDIRNILTILFYGTLLYTTSHIIQSLNQDLHQNYKVLQMGNGFTHQNGSSSHHFHKNHSANYKKYRHMRRSSTSSTESSDENQNNKCTVENRTLNILIVSMSVMILPFIPATNLFFYVGFVIAERVLYIPSMGFCLLVAEGAFVLHRKLKKSRTHQKIFKVLLGVLLLLLSIRTISRNRDWSTEERLYQSGITVNPAKAWGNLANIYNNQGRSLEAEQAYRNALKHRGNMADVHYNLGILLQDQKRYTEAIESYQNAIQFRPRLTLAHLNLAIVLGILGRHEEAIKVYRHCSEIDISGLKDPRLHESTKISALYNLGRLLTEQERYQEAIESYLEAIRRRPSHYAPQSIYNMLGEAYVKMDKFTEAEHWYQEALRAKADHIPAHLTMAKLCHRKGQLKDAEGWFQRGLRLDPNEGSVYQHYGQFLSDTGRHAQAADMYFKAAHLTPDDFELVFNTANALRQAQRNEEAETFYRKAANLRPNSASAHMNLGAMLHFNGKLKDAEHSYLNALKLKPDDELTQNNLQKLRNLLHNKGASNKVKARR